MLTLYPAGALLAVLLLACCCLSAPSFALDSQSRQALLDASAEHYRALLDHDPGNRVLRLEYARALSFARRYSDALVQYKEVLRQDSDNIPAMLGVAKVTSWQDDLDTSLELYSRVLKRVPSLYDALVGKAFTLLWMGRKEEALPLLRTAARRHPDDHEVIDALRSLGEQPPPAMRYEPPAEPSARPGTPNEPAAESTTAPVSSVFEPPPDYRHLPPQRAQTGRHHRASSEKPLAGEAASSRERSHKPRAAEAIQPDWPQPQRIEPNERSAGADSPLARWRDQLPELLPSARPLLVLAILIAVAMYLRTHWQSGRNAHRVAKRPPVLLPAWSMSSEQRRRAEASRPAADVVIEAQPPAAAAPAVPAAAASEPPAPGTVVLEPRAESRHAETTRRRDPAVHPNEARQEHHSANTLSGDILILGLKDAVREFQRRVLTGLGAGVLAAETPAEAVQLVRDHAVRAVILNESPIEPWGIAEVHAGLQRSQPGLERGLLLVIASLDTEQAAFVANHDLSVLIYPFGAQELEIAIRRVLGADSHAPRHVSTQDPSSYTAAV